MQKCHHETCRMFNTHHVTVRRAECSRIFESKGVRMMHFNHIARHLCRWALSWGVASWRRSFKMSMRVALGIDRPRVCLVRYAVSIWLLFIVMGKCLIPWHCRRHTCHSGIPRNIGCSTHGVSVRGDIKSTNTQRASRCIMCEHKYAPILHSAGPNCCAGFLRTQHASTCPSASRVLFVCRLAIRRFVIVRELAGFVLSYVEYVSRCTLALFV